MPIPRWNRGARRAPLRVLPAVVAVFASITGGAPLPAQRTLRVPEDHEFVQNAIDAARDNDVVSVAPGTWFENLDFKGKAITVTSRAGPAATVLDGGGHGSVVRFARNEGPGSVLAGFTIRNGAYRTVDGAAGPEAVGAGVFCRDASPVIHGNVIEHNGRSAPLVRPHRGAGIWCWNSSALIVDNVVRGNGSGSPGSAGGGVFLGGGGRPIVQRNVIAGNAMGDGGGIACDDLVEPVITDNLIAANIAYTFGGGIWCASPSATIHRNRVRGNLAADGGGMFLLEGAVVVAGNEVSGNRVDGDAGGGIHCRGGAPVLEGNVILRNDGLHEGGGVFLRGGTPLLRDNVVAHNRAQLLGGGIAADGGAPVLTNVTLHGNTAFSGGGLQAHPNVVPVVTNCVLWRNRSMVSGTEDVGGNVLVTYSLTENGLPGTGNQAGDPRFADPANDDFHLLAGSPCIDAGSLLAPGLDGDDFEGDPRAHGPAPDLGADERHPRLYVLGEATPAGTVQVRFAGAPGAFAAWLLSGDQALLAPPLSIPGLTGQLRLREPILTVPLGRVAADGLLRLAVPVPAVVPSPYVLPTQAVIGSELTNEWSFRW